MDEEPQPWTPEEVFVERVRALRRQRGWTLEEMGKQFEAAGYGAGSKQAMTQLEGSGVKRLTLNQVHAAAIAFGVTPIALLATEDPAMPIEITSGTTVQLGQYIEWWRGERTLIGDPRSEAHLIISTPRWLHGVIAETRTEREMTELHLETMRTQVFKLETENLALLKIVADQAAALAGRDR
ncbi:MAG: helix-turn-helix transcriptional regulator [Acidimicrobiia bacterium]